MMPDWDGGGMMQNIGSQPKPTFLDINDDSSVDPRASEYASNRGNGANPTNSSGSFRKINRKPSKNEGTEMVMPCSSNQTVQS